MQRMSGVAVIAVSGQLGASAVQPLRAAVQAAGPRPVILDLGDVSAVDESAAVLGGMCRYARARGSAVILVRITPLEVTLRQAGVLDLYETAADVTDALELIAQEQQAADLDMWIQG
jgi:anti-anti-sigma regulatory factor